MLSRFCATLFLTTSLAACVAGSSDEEQSGGAGGKADGETPVIVFDEDWSETKTGTLLAGDRVRIEYDLDRISECRGSTNGSDVWGVSGYASFDGSEPVAFAVSRLVNGRAQQVAASLEIPAGASTMELWFAANNRWGCIAYDSNDNANYVFDVETGASGPVLAFNADWSESQSETIRAGDQVVVHYDPSRLAQCSSSRNGYATWSVTAHWRVDGGAVKTLIATRSEGSTLVAADPTITVPRGSDLEMWFSATSVSGCNAYDSNLNANYHFTID